MSFNTVAKILRLTDLLSINTTKGLDWSVQLFTYVAKSSSSSNSSWF
ncbi:hypothetical protein BSPLISOX_2203 [uncultured Gammaproteobacteria bacterium]|nr:hypothetical protein BSPLISOX_2203 [uncultured Gammaproteobacteria bacterium]